MKAFISFAQRDHQLMHHLSGALAEKGISPLVATTRLSPGVRLDDKVKRMIRESHVVVLLNTPTASRSRWVQQEIGCAKAFSKTIIPLKTRGAKLAAMLEGVEYYEFKASDPADNFCRVASYLSDYADEKRIKINKKESRSDLNKLFQLVHLPQAMLCPSCKTVDVHVAVCLMCGDWVCFECGYTIPFDSTADSVTKPPKRKQIKKKKQ